MKDITEVPEMGWYSIIQDPTGSILGLWKSNPKMMMTDDAARKPGDETPARAH